MVMHLVTGGAGYLGNQIALALHSRGERVRILDILEPPDLPRGVEYVQCDILDRLQVESAMQGVDVVHHNAALVPVTKAGEHFRSVNVEGTQTALDCARKAGVELFIHVSSSAVFGVPESCPITSDTPLQPYEPYGYSKLEAERRCQGRAAVRDCSTANHCRSWTPRDLSDSLRLDLRRQESLCDRQRRPFVSIRPRSGPCPVHAAAC